MSTGKREERIVLIGVFVLFLAIGAMLLIVSVFSGGMVGD
jgi:hypothetical protein